MAEGHGTRINGKAGQSLRLSGFFVVVRKCQVHYDLQFVSIDKNVAFEYLVLTESVFYAIIIWS